MSRGLIGRRTAVRSLAVLAAVVIVSGLTACSPSGGGGSGDKTTIRLAITQPGIFDVNVPDEVAQKQGFYGAEGVQLAAKRVSTNGSSNAIQAIVSGSADIAVGVAVTAVYSALQQGAKLKIVAGEFQGYGDVTYYVPKAASLGKLTALNGQSVASNGPGSTTELLDQTLSTQLDSTGNKFKIVTLGGPPDVFTAVQTKQIDVGWTVPPFFFDKIADGSIRPIGTGADVTKLADTTARVIVASDDMVANHLDELKKFFRAYQKAIDWTYANPAQALGVWKSGSQLTYSDAVLDSALKSYPKSALDITKVEGVDTSLAIAKQLGFVKGDLTPEQVASATVVDKVTGQAGS